MLRTALILLAMLGLTACAAPQGRFDASPNFEGPPRDRNNPHRGA